MTQSVGISTTKTEPSEKTLADGLAYLLDVIEDGRLPYEQQTYVPEAYADALAECKAQLAHYEQRQRDASAANPAG